MLKTDKLSYEQWLVANKDKLFSAELIHELKHPKHSDVIDEVKRVVEQEYEDYLKREPLQITIEESQKTRGTVMKTQEEQLAFAKENLRLTNEYSRLHDELKQLKSPEDDAQIKLKLQESRNILHNMQQLSEAYMNTQQPPKPEFPKNRLVCDLCGDITESGKHTSVMCRFAKWIDSLSEKRK